MSDAFYRFVRMVGYHAFAVSSVPVWMHLERLPRRGACILAPTHLSPFDVPVLIATFQRNLDFMSSKEFLKPAWVGRFFKGMNCLFVDRRRTDPITVRDTLRKLKQRRAMVMFPEGYIRSWEDSVVHGKPFKPGVARIAQMSGAPIIPCVIIGTAAYHQWINWLPLQRVRYGINLGRPLYARADLEPEEAQKELAERLARAYVELYAELKPRLRGTVQFASPRESVERQPPSPSGRGRG